jgi:hypothetical protein
MKYITLQPATLDELFEISLESSRSKEGVVRIFEQSDLSRIIGNDRAEVVRRSFLDHKTKVQQIINNPEMPPFTDNDHFVHECMMFRYVPQEVYQIGHEVLMFDDVVAIYNIEPEVRLLVIRDAAYARNQKQLFSTLWREGQPPVLGFSYKPNHSFYNSIDFNISGVQLILWPDKDAKSAYGSMTMESLGSYLREIFEANVDFIGSADYVIGFIWSYEGDRMLDLWRFKSNHVDDRSGPLGDVRVFRNQKECSELGLASGNTLFVLGIEEKLRRQASSLRGYLRGDRPHLPLELLNGEDFF